MRTYRFGDPDSWMVGFQAWERNEPMTQPWPAFVNHRSGSTMKRYRVGRADDWIIDTDKDADPYLAWIASPFTVNCFCFVYEDEDLIAVIDCNGWLKADSRPMTVRDSLLNFIKEELEIRGIT